MLIYQIKDEQTSKARKASQEIKTLMTLFI
jgi:hypothetical protein